MWLAAGGALLVAEMLTVDLLFASLAFSAFMAAAANALGFNMAAQGLTFGIAAVISLFLLRPIALKNLKKRTPHFATNVDALIGAPALTITTITDRSGQVKLSGEIWSARSESSQISADSKVEVVSIEGATAVVKQMG
ncbi:MAG: NfeD family protein [Actinobacteria bacterium]|nr:NfeD family protein [Actinomycetota bacterium]TRZ84445.1 MAG: NfeD family protein [Streptomycetaceae bacterium]